MSTTMSKRASLEISGITMVYVTVSLAGLSLSLGIFGLPGVDWSTVLPVVPVVVGTLGTIAFLGLLFVTVCFHLLHSWARYVIVAIQTVVGMLVPLFLNPQSFLPRVDWEFVVLARFICFLASAGIVYYLAFGQGKEAFEGTDRPAVAGDRYCPLCLDRFAGDLTLCPECGVAVMQSYVDHEGATFARPLRDTDDEAPAIAEAEVEDAEVVEAEVEDDAIVEAEVEDAVIAEAEVEEDAEKDEAS